MMDKLPIPPELAELTGDEHPVEESIGRSDSRVLRLRAKDGAVLFAKMSNLDDAAALAEEARRLRWLSGAGVAVPDVVMSYASQGHAWLVTTCVPGADAAQSDAPVAERVCVMAEALRTLHTLDAGTCPFDESLPVKIARAEENVRLGKVREDLFDDAHQGMDPAELVKLLRSTMPKSEDIVLTHGDACLPNVLIEDGRFSGFVDCGNAGRADRYQDLALASRSIASNFGAEWVAPFFAGYGIEPVDQAKIAYYRLLDEFF